jgi:hypothetical protein
MSGALNYSPRGSLPRYTGQVTQATNPIDGEIAVHCTVRRLTAAYEDFGHTYTTGQTSNRMYSEILEFVNFRFETADSCRLLIENEKVADSQELGRRRSASS